MKYRILGKTNLKVSEIGLGTWQLANDPNCWVGGDICESTRALSRFLELGGNFIDTAWIYGYDEASPNSHPSEELIGQFLKETGKRKDVIIASKIPAKVMSWPLMQGTPIEQAFPNDWIEKCVNDSLKSIKTDYIDLMQFHVWNDDYATIQSWKDTIQKITKEGKVRFWGISVNDYQPSNCIKTLDTGLISTIQFIFNIFHQKPTEKLLSYAKANNIGLIARVPLDEGGLTGKITTSTVFAEGDFRNDYFGNLRKAELETKVGELKKLLGSEAQSLTELALRYILSFEEISATIPGMRKVEYVETNTAVSDGIKLSPALMEKLKKYAWERNFYSGLDPALHDTAYIEV